MGRSEKSKVTIFDKFGIMDTNKPSRYLEGSSEVPSGIEPLWQVLQTCA